jgi:hypothetical protein
MIQRVFNFPVLLYLFLGSTLNAQLAGLTGTVRDARTRNTLSGVQLELQGGRFSSSTDSVGRFFLRLPVEVDSATCEFSKKGYIPRRFTGLFTKPLLDIGVVYMEPEVPDEMAENLITLGDSDLFDDDTYASGSGFLQASRDVFLNRAAFDFSPAFFRIRGYDTRNAAVYINGIPMNRFYDGRPQWNNWGGLNDVTRNQQYLPGLRPVGPGFGGLRGTTLIEISPAALREGYRLTLSGSNRSYTARFMGTYNSGIRRGGWGWLFSFSRRLARQGYMEGTPYNAYSFLGGVSFMPSEKHEFTATAMLASNLRGRSSALSRETIELGGRRYNPYWGFQDGKIRSSRLRYISEPWLNFRYRYRAPHLTYTFTVAYQWGRQYRTRLGYFNAPNPDPAYYRNLPSYYWNSPIGPNLLSGEAARLGFLASPQLNWDALYTANRLQPSGRAAYLLLSDRNEEVLLTGNTYAHLNLGRGWSLGAGVLFQNSKTRNYALIEDMLGAGVHPDTDPFSQTRNDLEGTLEKKEGDRVGYDYAVHARRWEAFASLEADFDRGSAFLSLITGKTVYRREGFFRNERFPADSKGEAAPLSFTYPGVRGGGAYRITGRHWARFNASFMQRPPVVRNLYVNPRDRKQPVPERQNEKVMTTDLSYYFRGQALSCRLTAFYTRMMDLGEVNFFFTDSGYGSAFVQEVTTGIDVLHKGLELGLEYEFNPAVKFSAALALGDYRYASQPGVTLYFQPGTDPGDLQAEEGRLSLGTAGIKGFKRAAGPSRAVSLGLHYRDPKYWWAGVTVNHLAAHYPDLSFLRHTPSFRLDPETGGEVSGVDPGEFQHALRQRPLEPIHLLNLTGGKSWRWDSNYISLFISVSNLLDSFFLSGGYELGRKGNYREWDQDRLSGRPSFGPRFWPGYGRTFFINLSWSFK